MEILASVCKVAAYMAEGQGWNLQRVRERMVGLGLAKSTAVRTDKLVICPEPFQVLFHLHPPLIEIVRAILIGLLSEVSRRE